jgi:hypothetical protein
MAINSKALGHPEDAYATLACRPPSGAICCPETSEEPPSVEGHDRRCFPVPAQFRDIHVGSQYAMVDTGGAVERLGHIRLNSLALDASPVSAKSGNEGRPSGAHSVFR